MAVPSRGKQDGSCAVESDKGLGEMLAEANSRCCTFLPIFWFYSKENTAHSSLQLLSFDYEGKYQHFPTPAGSPVLDVLLISGLNYQGVSSASWGAHPPGLFR